MYLGLKIHAKPELGGTIYPGLKVHTKPALVSVQGGTLSNKDQTQIHLSFFANLSLTTQKCTVN